MEYSNPKIPEGINTSPRQPLKELALLLAGVVAVVILLVAALGLSADFLAKKVPFEIEQDWSQAFFEAPTAHPLENYLNALANQLARFIDTSDNFEFQVHYVDSDEVNAYAFLGGNIVLTRGLLEQLATENTVAMVLAHEMAHVVERHPIRSLGRGLVVAAFLSAAFGFGSDWLGGNIVSEAGLISQLKFSRDQEREADAIALAALEQHYGHIEGAASLFEVFVAMEQTAGLGAPAFLSTHPTTAERIAAVNTNSGARTSSGRGALTALPANFKRMLAAQVETKSSD